VIICLTYIRFCICRPNKLVAIRLTYISIIFWANKFVITHLTYVFVLCRPNKLLFKIGIRGRADGDFNYPRGLASTVDSNILVADTKNHRIQILNQFGVLIRVFGKRGFKEGQFNEPTGVTELPNCDIAVADKNNRRVQVFSSKGEFKYQFPTSVEPFCISCDDCFNLVVSTCARTIEIYRRGGKMLHNFPIGICGKTKHGCQICVNNKSEVLVCDPVDGLIKYFTYDGRLLYITTWLKRYQFGFIVLCFHSQG